MMSLTNKTVSGWSQLISTLLNQQNTLQFGVHINHFIHRLVCQNAFQRVCICVYLTKLNECLLREASNLSTRHCMGQSAGVKYFSKLDDNSGFWQVPFTFSPPSLHPWTIWFNWVPFGITSAPEQFHQRISAILSSLNGVSSWWYPGTKEEHDLNLRNALMRLAQANLTRSLESQGSLVVISCGRLIMCPLYPYWPWGSQ